MKTTQIYGVISLGLTGVSLIIAAVAMFLSSWILGTVYVAFCCIASFAIIYGFCAKCPCQDCCGHVFPGKIARHFARPSAPYTPLELSVLTVALLLLFGFPLPWLWHYKSLFIAFVVLNGIALTQVLAFVCKACNNIHCPIKIVRPPKE